MALVRVVVTMRLPWWWRLYLAGAWLCEYTIGGIDPDVCAEFIMRNGRCHVSTQPVREEDV